MKLLPSPDIWGYTIFCDDIRQEVGEKVSFIGVYAGTMFIHGEFPFTIPKFCFATTLCQRGEILDPNIQVQIFLPGDSEDAPSITAQSRETVEGAVAAQTAAEVEGLPMSDERILAMHMHLIASPLQLKEAGVMKVRALLHGELIRLGSIRIVSQPQALAAPAS